MSKQKEHKHRRKQQAHSRWLITTGFIILLVVVSWLIFSNGQFENTSARPISRLTTADFHSLAFSPTEPETVFFGHHGGMLMSLNGGKDWESTTLNNADAMALAFPFSDPQTMYAAGHDVFFKSTNAGQTWESVDTNLPGTDIHGFTVDPENANQVYAHVVGFGIFGSRDGGKTWTLLSSSMPGSTFNLSIGADADTLYAAAGEAGLWVSKDSGQTWSRLPEIPDAGAIAVTYLRASDRLYVTTLGSAAGLYSSEDGGQTWTFAGLGGTILAFAVSPLDPKHIVAVNDQGEVLASRDGGISWSDE